LVPGRAPPGDESGFHLGDADDLDDTGHLEGVGSHPAGRGEAHGERCGADDGRRRAGQAEHDPGHGLVVRSDASCRGLAQAHSAGAPMISRESTAAAAPALSTLSSVLAPDSGSTQTTAGDSLARSSGGAASIQAT
jgi:hypothetical protein